MGSATTGWFNAGSSPTVQTKCDVTLSRNGTTVTANWTVHMKLSSSESYLEVGSLDVYSSCSTGSGSGTIKPRNTEWYGTTEHTYSGSYTFQDSSTTEKSFTVNFSSDSDTFYSSGIFETSVSCSVEGYAPYAHLTKLEVKSRTVNSITLSFTTDRAAWLFAKLDGGEWLNSGNPFASNVTSGEFTIYYKNKESTQRLDPNTTYRITILCRAGGRHGDYDTSQDINGTTYQIATISSASNFNHGDNSSLVVANPSGASMTLQMKIGNTQIFSKSISAGTVTNTFTDSQLDSIYRLYGTANSLTVTYIVSITVNGTTYTSSKTCTVTLKGNQKTSYVGSGGKKRAKVYVGVNGSVKRAVVWVGNNNTRKRCI